MINFSQLNEIQVLMFGLILIRMSGFVVSAAIFGTNNLSAPLKILLSLVFALTMYKTVATNEAIVRLQQNEGDLLLLAGREVLLGLIFGFITRFFFFAVSMTGEMVSVAMGLGQAQIFNPMVGSMGNAMEQFYSVIATLVFFAFNGHHVMISGLADSFLTAQVADLTFYTVSFSELVLRVQSFFIIGIKMAAPVVISMMIAQLGIALLSRVVPQINVIVTSASITVLIGFVIIFISLPLLVMQMGGLIDFSMMELFKFIKSI